MQSQASVSSPSGGAGCKTMGMGEPGLWYLGSGSSVCKGTAKQALKPCMSPDSRDEGLALGAMGVTVMNTRA